MRALAKACRNPLGSGGGPDRNIVRLFIGNLPYAATEADLRNHLSAVGEPASVYLPVDRETGRPRGFAFVEYTDRNLAEEAIRRLNGQPFMGRAIAVSEARARDASGPPPPRMPRPSFEPGGPPAAPGTLRGERPGRTFGPDAPKRRPGSGPPRKDQKPKGPIPTKTHGRVYDVDSFGEDTTEEIPDFENFATSLPEDAKKTDDEET
jgi:RNA recognition motif-containing protein